MNWDDLEIEMAARGFKGKVKIMPRWAPVAFHSGLDVRGLSKKIGELSTSGKSAEEIAKEIDPDEFDGTFFIRPWKKWRVGTP